MRGRHATHGRHGLGSVDSEGQCLYRRHALPPGDRPRHNPDFSVAERSDCAARLLRHGRPHQPQRGHTRRQSRQQICVVHDPPGAGSTNGPPRRPLFRRRQRRLLLRKRPHRLHRCRRRRLQHRQQHVGQLLHGRRQDAVHPGPWLSGQSHLPRRPLAHAQRHQRQPRRERPQHLRHPHERLQLRHKPVRLGGHHRTHRGQTRLLRHHEGTRHLRAPLRRQNGHPPGRIRPLRTPRLQRRQRRQLCRRND